MKKTISGPRAWQPPVEPKEVNWPSSLDISPEFDWTRTATKGTLQTLELSAESHRAMLDDIENQLLLLRHYDSLLAVRRRLKLRLRIFESMILHDELADQYLADATWDDDMNDDEKWNKVNQAYSPIAQRLTKNRAIVEDLKEQILRCSPNEWLQAQQG